MSRIRHSVCPKLHHLQVVDLASSKWNVSIEFLCRAWNMFFFSFCIWKRVYILQNSSIALKYRSKYGTSRRRDISLRLSSSEQTNGSTSSNNKMAVDSLIMRFSVHINLLFFLFRNPFLLRKYNSKHWVTKKRSIAKVSLIHWVYQ